MSGGGGGEIKYTSRMCTMRRRMLGLVGVENVGGKIYVTHLRFGGELVTMAGGDQL